MKNNNFKVLALALFLSVSGFSQENNQNDDGGQQIINKVYNYTDQPLQVEGIDNEPPVVDSELNFINNELKKQKNQIYLNKEKTKKYRDLQDTTEKLVDTTEDYVEERRSSESQIKEYNKKIKCLLDENALDPDCKKPEPVATPAPVAPAPQVVQPVIVQQAAPTPTVVVADSNETFEEPATFMDTLKILPDVGFRVYSDNLFYQQVDSTPVLGLRVESELNRRVALGVGLNFHSITFFDGSVGLNGWFNNYGYGSFGGFMDGVPLDLDSITLDMYGKLYLTNSLRLRPFVGGGIAISRMSLEYEQTDFGSSFGGFDPFTAGESFSQFGVFGNLKAGAEFSLNKNFGFFVEGNYNKGITDFGSTQFGVNALGGDVFLPQVAEEFARSDSFGINAGVTVSF